MTTLGSEYGYWPWYPYCTVVARIPRRSRYMNVLIKFVRISNHEGGLGIRTVLIYNQVNVQVSKFS